MASRTEAHTETYTTLTGRFKAFGPLEVEAHECIEGRACPVCEGE